MIIILMVIGVFFDIGVCFVSKFIEFSPGFGLDHFSILPRLMKFTAAGRLVMEETLKRLFQEWDFECSRMVVVWSKLGILEMDTVGCLLFLLPNSTNMYT